VAHPLLMRLRLSPFFLLLWGESYLRRPGGPLFFFPCSNVRVAVAGRREIELLVVISALTLHIRGPRMFAIKVP
jgi:hypothetical protein